MGLYVQRVDWRNRMKSDELIAVFNTWLAPGQIKKSIYLLVYMWHSYTTHVLSTIDKILNKGNV